jgi:hypothetical protein
MMLHPEYPAIAEGNWRSCFRQFSKVRANCRSRSSQIWITEPDPSLKGATGQNSTSKSKGLRAGSNLSKKGLIIRGMLTPPDRPSRSLVLRFEDAKDSNDRHSTSGRRQTILKRILMPH